MKYVPLRVYSVFSKGEGAVAADELAEVLKKAGIPSLAVSDPHSFIAWESFKRAADNHGLRPLPGIEIRLRERASLVLFPLSQRGYLSLVVATNQRRIQAMEEVAIVFVPLLPDRPLLEKVRRQVAADNFFLGLEWLSPRWIVEWARELHIPLVWANPLRWLTDAQKYAVAAAVFNHLPLQEALARDVSLSGLLPAAAVTRRWGEAGQEALANTLRLAERGGFAFERLEAEGETVAAPGGHLARQIEQKLAERRATAAERERAGNELRIIVEMGFEPYFIIAAELADFCRRQGILFNLRGSGVASFVLFLLGISPIDPLSHGLLFERFVNRLRGDLPDIDIDFDSSRRSEVFDWAFARYRRQVAFVSTHKFFAARSALYETARCAGFSPDEAHALTKSLPLFAAPHELRGRGRGRLAEIYAAAARLEGVYKELSLHVGGLVFSQQPVGSVFPLERSPAGYPQIVWNRDGVERLRIFKLDLLSVRGFEVIAPLTGQTHRPDPQDAAVWETIANARTIGCFQLESPLARENLLKARPRNLAELAISVAIIRPGPARSGMKQAYLEKQAPLHPLLGRLFADTRGALIFEEQIARLLHQLSGWSLEKAEQVRKELKKKRAAGPLREEFFVLARDRGFAAADLELIWKRIEDFSVYAFCQAHSVAYAHSAFLSAWFKTKFPLTFFCRLLNAGGGYHPLPVYIDEAKRWGIAVLPPDINRSQIGFSQENGGLRTGLIFIKGVGEKLAARIVAQRGAGYPSLPEFMMRSGCGQRDLSTLLAATALTSLNIDGFPRAEKERNWRRLLGFLPGPSQPMTVTQP